MGYFVLQAGNQYVWGFGKGAGAGTVRGKGHYAFDGNGIHFTDGPLKGIQGEFHTKADGRHNITLKVPVKKPYAKHSGKVTWTCNCDRHDPRQKNKS